MAGSKKSSIELRHITKLKSGRRGNSASDSGTKVKRPYVAVHHLARLIDIKKITENRRNIGPRKHPNQFNNLSNCKIRDHQALVKMQKSKAKKCKKRNECESN